MEKFCSYCKSFKKGFDAKEDGCVRRYVYLGSGLLPPVEMGASCIYDDKLADFFSAAEEDNQVELDKLGEIEALRKRVMDAFSVLQSCELELMKITNSLEKNKDKADVKGCHL